MKLRSKKAVLIFTLAMLLLGLGGLTLRFVQAQDRDDYGFDWQDYWKEYGKLGYPAGSRLPCNGGSESTCTWAWEPWYEHQTDIPRFQPEMYTGVTVEGYALKMEPYSYASDDLHGGVFRREAAEPCHTYRFTMWSRSGLEDNPAPTNARMRIGISPTGDYPDQIVLTDSDIGKIVWSDSSNSKHSYEELSVEVESGAESDAVTAYTRAEPDSDHPVYIVWDEGSFEDISLTRDLIDPNEPMTGAMGYIYRISEDVSANSATIRWDTGARETFGQVLYRPATQEAPSPGTYTYTTYLPLIMGGAARDWYLTAVDNWKTDHRVDLSGLSSGTTYEYIIVSYGAVDGKCTTLVTDTSAPRTFTTP